VIDVRLAAALLVLGAAACNKQDAGGTRDADANPDSAGSADVPSGPGADAGRSDSVSADAIGPSDDAATSADAAAQGGAGCPSMAPADWIFCEDFERGAAALDRFVEKSDAVHLRVVADGRSHSGTYALFVPAGADVNFEGGSATWSSWPTGYQELHLRVFVRLADDFDSAHHFPLAIWGSRKDDMYSSYGLAGCRPNGTNFFTTQLDLTRDFGATPAPGRFILYTYWPDMTCDPGDHCSTYADPMAICDNCATRGAPCTNGLECCWGQNLAPATPISPPRGVYQCLEMSARMNDVGSTNGWIAFSVEGTERYRLGGLSLRTSDILELSTAIVGIYNAGGDSTQPNQAWFDDMVISTSPIGCR
jgi:hypothetical protein